ncbi:MAG: Tricarboxylate transporter family protein, partial [Acidiferrobacteraceae bacterium]|nr:Tricarboxylate transporter family protein [Acidiferrobacteraceae bacterium]
MDLILLGIQDALTLTTLLTVAAGVCLGIVVGAIPGLNAPMAIAIAVPLTFYMTPLAALAFLISVNKGGSFGGSISGILLNTPGSPEAAATAIDGYPLARKGRPITAMQTALGASVCGDLFSDIVLVLVAAPLALVALKLGPV